MFFSSLYIDINKFTRECAKVDFLIAVDYMKNHLLYQLEITKVITCNTEAFVNYKIRTLKQLVSIRQFSAFRRSTELRF